MCEGAARTSDTLILPGDLSVSVLFPEIFHYGLQVITDRETLGAFLCALPALLAEGRVLWSAVHGTTEEGQIDPPGLFLVFVHVPTVIIFKALRDAHPMWTRHAVLASGAGDYDPLFQLFFYVLEQGEFCLCQ